MNWTLHIHPTVTQMVRRLPKAVHAQVWPFILSLQKNPSPSDATVVTGHPDLYEVTVAGFRLVYQIKPDGKIVRVVVLQKI